MANFSGLGLIACLDELKACYLGEGKVLFSAARHWLGGGWILIELPTNKSGLTVEPVSGAEVFKAEVFKQKLDSCLLERFLLMVSCTEQGLNWTAQKVLAFSLELYDCTVAKQIDVANLQHCFQDGQGDASPRNGVMG